MESDEEDEDEDDEEAAEVEEAVLKDEDNELDRVFRVSSCASIQGWIETDAVITDPQACARSVL